MKRIPLLLLALAAMLLSCGMPSVLLSTSTPRPIQTPHPSDGTHPIVTPVCISPEPTQKDVDRALAYTGTVLDSSEWKRSYTVSKNRVSVTWQSSPQGATIYLEALIFPCQYREADLDHYFSDENWKTIFLNYQSHELVEECKTSGGLRLYEFKAVSQGFDYTIHYWVAGDSDTRVISTMAVFPFGSEAALTDFATRLFPDLPSCS